MSKKIIKWVLNMYNQKQQSITNTSNFLKFILNLIQK